MAILPPRALNDPVLCLAPNLFRSLSRGRREEPLAIDYRHGSEQFIFSAPELLGCDDLRLLQGLVSLAGRAVLCIAADSTSTARGLRSRLHLSGDAVDDAVVLVQTSLSMLAAAAGYAPGRGGAMGDQIRQSLSRLASLEVKLETATGSEGWRLISWDEGGISARRRLRIALNPRLGLCTSGKARFVQIDMAEARRIKGDLARLLHQRLCGFIDLPTERKASSRQLLVSTLLDYGWGRPPPSADAARQRRCSLRTALAELAAVGWGIRNVPGRDGLIDIVRPAKKSPNGTPDHPDATGERSRAA